MSTTLEESPMTRAIIPFLGSLLLAGAAGLAGCDATEAPPDPAAPEPPAPEPVTRTPEAQMPSNHPDMGQLQELSRGPRRMSVEQIERSLEAIANLPQGEVEIPPDLALTLGEPDYLTSTEESLEPSPLFMKFMMDLGAIVCTNLGQVDPGRPAEQRVYTRYDTVDDNVRFMVLRFTGIEGEAADPYVERLLTVHEEAAAGSRGEIGGYEAVCLALFTSPEFLLY